MDSILTGTIGRAFAVIGLLVVFAKLFSITRLILDLFISSGIPLSKFGPKGSWVVITGASDGIGKEFAVQLARKGFNLVLVSRTAAKLDSLAQELKTNNTTLQTKTLAMDFAENKEEDYTKLKQMVKGLDVAILINNVGLSHSIPVPFLETPEQEMKDIITINCMGTLRVTEIVAPNMITQKRGLILTMASFGGVFPTPLLATYSGSKAFLQQWGTALGAELAPHGVTVQVVQSHLVTSAMSKIKRSSLMVPTPREFVRACLGKIGLQGGAQGVPYTLTPWWSHAVMQWGIVSFVGQYSSIVLGQNKTMHESIRKRALRKAEREGKKAQ